MKASPTCARDRFAYLQQDLATLADGPSVTVGAVVEGGAQELAEQVAVRRMQLHPVAARDLYVERRLPESLDHVVDVLLLHDHRDLVVHDRGHLGDTPERVPLVHDHRALVVHAAAEELDELPRAVLVHSVGQLGVLGDGALLPRRTSFEERPLAQPVAGLLLGDEEGRTPLRALPKKLDMPVAEDVVLAEKRRLGGHHDPVLHVRGADLHWLPHQTKLGRGLISLGCRCAHSFPPALDQRDSTLPPRGRPTPRRARGGQARSQRLG